MLKIMSHAPGIQLPECSEVAINRKTKKDVIICWHDVIVIFCDIVSLVGGPNFIRI